MKPQKNKNEPLLARFWESEKAQKRPPPPALNAEAKAIREKRHPNRNRPRKRPGAISQKSLARNVDR